MKILFYFILFLIIFLAIVILWAKSEYLSSKNFSKEDNLFYKQFDDERLKVSSEKLKVVTWNIGYASGKWNNHGHVLEEAVVKKNLNEIVQKLKALDADVIFLQEVDFKSARSFDVNQLEFLQKELKMPYASYRVLWNKNYVAFPYWPVSKHFGHVVSGQAVLSRLPMVSKKVVVLPKPPHAFWYNWFYLDRIQQKMDVNWHDNVTITLWNVHHEAFHAPTRKHHAKNLAKDVQKNYWSYKIAAGDFNDPTTEDLHKLIDDDYSDTVDLFEKTSGLMSDQTYFPEQVKTFASFALRDKLDHVFISDTLQFKNRKIICSEASDHCLVYAEITKKE